MIKMKLKFKILTFVCTLVSLVAFLTASQMAAAEFFPSGGQGGP
jgi:hypothetical protein